MLPTINTEDSKDADKVFSSVSRYVINDRFNKQINSQICQATVAEIKYQLSIIEISKNNEAIAKQSLESEINAISFDRIRKQTEKAFYNASASGDYFQIIRVFNEKGIAKSVGHYMGIQDKEYCDMVVNLIQKGKVDAWSTVGKYMPTEIPR